MGVWDVSRPDQDLLPIVAIVRSSATLRLHRQQLGGSTTLGYCSNTTMESAMITVLDTATLLAKHIQRSNSVSKSMKLCLQNGCHKFIALYEQLNIL